MTTVKKRVSLYLTDEQNNSIESIAKLSGISKNSVIQSAIAQYVLAYNALMEKLDISELVKKSLNYFSHTPDNDYNEDEVEV